MIACFAKYLCYCNFEAKIVFNTVAAEALFTTVKVKVTLRVQLIVETYSWFPISNK
jgi:hypothetical protein